MPARPPACPPTASEQELFGLLHRLLFAPDPAAGDAPSSPAAAAAAAAGAGAPATAQIGTVARLGLTLLLSAGEVRGRGVLPETSCNGVCRIGDAWRHTFVLRRTLLMSANLSEYWSLCW